MKTSTTNECEKRGKRGRRKKKKHACLPCSCKRAQPQTLQTQVIVVMFQGFLEIPLGLNAHPCIWKIKIVTIVKPLIIKHHLGALLSQICSVTNDT